jgi:hypothetical protein
MSEVIAALLGAVVGAWASVHLLARHEKRQWKFDVLKRCMAHRNDVTGDPFSAAINEATLIYSADEEVLAAIRDMWAGSSNDKAARLLRAMASACGVHNKHLSDQDFLTVFNNRKPGHGQRTLLVPVQIPATPSQAQAVPKNADDGSVGPS